MSGHSHWATIKRQKQAADQKRGQIFSKLARLITVTARQGGPDPEVNPSLRQAIEKAREFSMPKDNIERAINRGTGQGTEDAQLVEVLYEGYGPGGTAFIIEGITDNKNRALSEVKQILQKHSGKLAAEGSVRWLFEPKGVIVINYNLQIADDKHKEVIELAAIEAGAEDCSWQEQGLEVYTKLEDLEKVKQGLQAKGYKVETAVLGFKPKEEMQLGQNIQAKVHRLLEELDDTETVQNVYTNVKL